MRTDLDRRCDLGKTAIEEGFPAVERLFSPLSIVDMHARQRTEIRSTALSALFWSRQSLDRRFLVSVFEKRLAILCTLRGLNLTNPNIAKCDRVTMILNTDRTSFVMLGILRRAVVWGVSLELEVVQNQHAVMDGGDVCR